MTRGHSELCREASLVDGELDQTITVDVPEWLPLISHSEDLGILQLLSLNLEN